MEYDEIRKKENKVISKMNRNFEGTLFRIGTSLLAGGATYSLMCNNTYANLGVSIAAGIGVLTGGIIDSLDSYNDRNKPLNSDLANLKSQKELYRQNQKIIERYQAEQDEKARRIMALATDEYNRLEGEKNTQKKEEEYQSEQDKKAKRIMDLATAEYERWEREKEDPSNSNGRSR